MTNARNMASKLLITLTLVCGLVSSSFAHTGFRVIPSPEIAAYLAAGGVLADICGNASDQDGTAPQKCEACRLIETVFSSSNDVCMIITLSAEMQAQTFVAKRLRQTLALDAARLSRAPPKA